jgi:hypothetical protein
VLLGGGGSDLFWFEEVAAVALHSVTVLCGAFVRHWSAELPTPRLALVSRMLRLALVDDEDDPGGLWVVLVRFPAVEMSAGNEVTLGAEEWKACVASASAQETVFTLLDDFTFACLTLRLHTVCGAYAFMSSD